MTKRLTAAQWTAVDIVVAVGALMLLVAVVAARHTPRDTGPVPLYGLAMLSSLPLMMRRRWPLTVLAVVLVASVTFGILVSATSTVTGATYVLYVVALQSERRRAVVALGFVVAGVATSFAFTRSGNTQPANEAFIALVQVTVWMIGDSVRRRRAYAATLEERSVRDAVTEERLRLARELHDVVAHAMSVVVVQASVASHLIETRPHEAHKALDAIEVTTRSALVEMRHLLGVLRRDDSASVPLSPSPGLANLPMLVERMADAGLPAMLRVEGEPGEVLASVELSAYRIVQEALTNVLKHAEGPSRVAVVLRYGVSEVGVEVVDDGRSPVADPRTASGSALNGSGQGLAGMRQRVDLFGGELTVGPRPEGGFQVIARLPVKGLQP